VDDDMVLNQHNLAAIKMGNSKQNFIPDDRPDTSNTRCMENCKDASKIVITRLMGAAAEVKEDLDTTSSTDDIKILSENAKKGESVYNSTCKSCHSIGIAGSPKFGDSKEWGTRFSKGKDVLYQGAINGYEGDAGFMPAKGGKLSLTDDEVKAAVDYMLESSL
jgi:cytochrome c